jgi:hypothetical protein
MRKGLGAVLGGVAVAATVACGSSSSSGAPAQPTAMTGTVGGHAFTPAEMRGISLGSGTTPCMLSLNPADPSMVTTVGVKAVVVEAATHVDTCSDLQSSQCRLHASSQTVTLLIARLNLMPPAAEPTLAAGTYTVSTDLSHPTTDAAGPYVAYAQVLAVDPSFAASTGTPVAGGTIHLDQVSGPVTGSVSLKFTDGSSVEGGFSAPFCSGATDACALAGTLASAIAGGGAQGLCTQPPVNVP